MKNICVALFLIICAVPAVLTINNRNKALPGSIEPVNYRSFKYTVILDAGHGGEDGGAVAPDGTAEKDINLSFTRVISDYFELFGIQYIAVRTSDIAVGDNSLSTIKARKTSDIMTRYALVNDTDNSILLSIHQNKFEIEKYYGTQVFYSANDELSEKIAKSIQDAVFGGLQPDNKREVKRSPGTIFLLYKAKRPSVLVECGFLSNKRELDCLKSPEYRAQLSYFIIKGFYTSLN